MDKHNERKYRGREVAETARALRHEGKVSHETLEWFEKAYAKKLKLEEQKKRHESLSSVGALGQ